MITNECRLSHTLFSIYIYHIISKWKTTDNPGIIKTSQNNAANTLLITENPIIFDKKLETNHVENMNK